MAWSDAAREAARLTRQRKKLSLKSLRKGVSTTARDLFRARVNLENYSNPTFAKKGGYSRSQISRGTKDFKSVIASNRRLNVELIRRLAARGKAK